MNTATGDRKASASRRTAWFLLAGLIISLVASGWFKIDTATCVQGYVVFTAGLVGKDTAFMWGNAKEHAAKAQPPVNPV